MPIQDANTLKGYFNKGDVPTEDNYVDLIDTIYRPTSGDMQRSVYDPDLDGVVENADQAANADKLDGQDGTYYAPSTKGVTNGDLHDHSGGDGAQINHTGLSNIGTNTHAQIDAFVSSKSMANGLASLDSNGKVVQDPANATAIPTIGKIPLADGAGKLDSWINDGDTTIKGKVRLATDGENIAGKAVQGNDSRLSNARTPTSHGNTHTSIGSDPIPSAIPLGASGLLTGADKSKLDSIAVGAEVNVNADWNAVSGDAQILNKPSTFSPSAHNLLSTSHGDSLSATVAQGDLIYGNLTPKWSRMAKGPLGSYLRIGWTSTTEPEWGRFDGWHRQPETWTYSPILNNLLSNTSFESDTSNWGGSGGTTLTRTAGGVWGNWMCRVVQSGGSGSNYSVYNNSAVLANGTQYRISFYARTISGNTSLHCEVNGGVGGTNFAITSSWVRYSLTVTGNGNAGIYFWLTGGTGTYEIDAILIQQTTTTYPYFDGTFRTGTHFAGTYNNSISIMDVSRLFASGDLRGYLYIGMQIKMLESSVIKYFNVINIIYNSLDNVTQILLYAGSDYVLQSSPSVLWFGYGSCGGFPSYFNFPFYWTAVTTNPVIGNGTTEGMFSMIGSVVNITGHIVMGSTTTYGSGEYRFALPFTIPYSFAPIVNFLAFDSGTAWRSDSGYADQFYPIAIAMKDGSGAWSPTIPQTWANNDQLWLTATFHI